MLKVCVIPTMLWKQFGLLNTYDPLTWPSLLAWGPMYVFLLRQYFLTIPREMEEAARIDGANEFSILFRIYIPLSKPVLVRYNTPR